MIEAMLAGFHRAEEFGRTRTNLQVGGVARRL